MMSLCPKDAKSAYCRITCTSVFNTALFTSVKLWGQPRYPWTHVDKENVAYIRKRVICWVIKMNEIGVIGWFDWEDGSVNTVCHASMRT